LVIKTVAVITCFKQSSGIEISEIIISEHSLARFLSTELVS